MDWILKNVLFLDPTLSPFIHPPPSKLKDKGAILEASSGASYPVSIVFKYKTCYNELYSFHIEDNLQPNLIVYEYRDHHTFQSKYYLLVPEEIKSKMKV